MTAERLRGFGAAALCMGASWLACSHALAQQQAASSQTAQSAPSSAELEASTAVLDASGDAEVAQEDAKQEHDAQPFEITWTTLLTASGGEPETNLQLDETGWRVEDLLLPRRNKLYPSTALSIYGELEATDWLLFRALFDTREIRDGATLEPPLEGVTINGNPAVDEIRSGSMLREISALIGSGAFTLEVGRFRADVAEGLVYEDFSAGLRFRADLDSEGWVPLQIELLLTTVGQRVQDLDNNQLGALRVDWMFSPFEYVGLFLAGSEDENGEISEVLRSAYAETLLGDQQHLNALFLQDEGHGRHSYIGAHAQLILGDDWVLRARLVLSGGELTLRVPLETITTEEQAFEGNEITVKVGGIATDAELRYGVSEAVELKAFTFLLSGDAPPGPEGGEYKAFIGLAPFWVWSGLFFSGGLAQGLYPNRASAAGVNGRGVVGLGPGIELTRGDFSAEMRVLLLGATADPPAAPVGGTSRAYGTELDWRAEWKALPILQLGAELDLFIPGDFFPSDDVGYLVLCMVSLTNAR